MIGILDDTVALRIGIGIGIGIRERKLLLPIYTAHYYMPVCRECKPTRRIRAHRSGAVSGRRIWLLLGDGEVLKGDVLEVQNPLLGFGLLGWGAG